MPRWIIYLLIVLWMVFLILTLERDKLKRVNIDLKAVMIILIIIFFFGSAVASFFS